MQTGQWGDIGNSAQNAQQIQNAGGSTVVGAIRMASARTGVDFAYLLNKADQESGFNPSAKASSSSASGLFQFISQTWLKMVKEHGGDYGLGQEAGAITMKNGHAQVRDPTLREKILNMRHDPVLSAAMAAEYTRENKDYLDAKVGGHIGSTELYLAHFLGAGGAEKFIKAMRASPNDPAASVLPEAADSNPAVFYNTSGAAKSLKQIYNHFAAKFKNHPVSHFAEALKETAPASTPSVMTASATAPVPSYTRDLAELSPSLYHAPEEETASNAPASHLPGLEDWKRGGGADTLFNVMVLAQRHINDALMGTHKDKAA